MRSRARCLKRWTGAFDPGAQGNVNKGDMSMSNRVIKKPVAVAIGAALISSIAVAGIAQASAFAVTSLGSGYMLSAGDPPPAAPAEDKPAEGKCGEGKCGDKKGEGKCGEGKCGEGKCGADKKGEGKCGEGKCGADKKPEEVKPEEKPKT